MPTIEIKVCGLAHSGKSTVMEIIKRTLTAYGLTNVEVCGFAEEDQSKFSNSTDAELQRYLMESVGRVKIKEILTHKTGLNPISHETHISTKAKETWNDMLSKSKEI